MDLSRLSLSNPLCAGVVSLLPSCPCKLQSIVVPGQVWFHIIYAQSDFPVYSSFRCLHFFNTDDPIRCFSMCPAISADIEGDAFEGLILDPSTFAKASSCTLMPCDGRQEVHAYYQDCSDSNSLYQGILWQPSQWWWSLSCYSLLFPIFITHILSEYPP